MNTPKIRFKEFNDEWKYEPLSNYVDRIITKNKDNVSSLVLTISAQFGLVDQTRFFNKNVSSNNLAGYYLLNKGDFAYNKSYSNGYPWGAIKRLNKYNMGVVSSLYICFKPNKKINSDYLEQYFETNKWYHQMSEVSVEGARNHGLLNIAVGDFFSTEHFIPTLDEQKKISKFLSLLDKKIGLQSKKIEDLKLFTKKLLKIIINSHNCIERTVDSVAEIYLGLTYTPQYVEKGVPFLSVKDISSGTINNSDIKYISQEEYDSCTSNSKPKKGDILFGRVGTLGCPIIINDNIDRCIFVSLGFLRLKTNDLSAEIIKYWMLSDDFKNQINKKIAGSSQKNLNTGWLKKFVIRYPKDIKEQEKYLKVANTLDKKLKLEMVYLEKLIKQKKGFMQNMFV